MTSSYKHISIEERYQIHAYHKSGMSRSEIAKELCRHKSTISRELKRNKGKRGYRPKQAHQMFLGRQRTGNEQITEFGWHYIAYLIRSYWSPEQINGRLTIMGWGDVPSHESIYKYIYEDKASGGELHKFLRCKKVRKKRYGSCYERRGSIKHRHSIHERTVVADNRERIGDLEGDTIVGHNHTGYLLTLVDRKSRVTKIRPSGTKHAQIITELTLDALDSLPVNTITYDNGKEFAEHYHVSERLNIQTYFADPYSSWQRGTNENTNGLIRQFFPKKMSFEKITRKQTDYVENLLNNRPRKILDYATPLEVQFRC